jgi:hypothetical protein
MRAAKFFCQFNAKREQTKCAFCAVLNIKTICREAILWLRAFSDLLFGASRLAAAYSKGNPVR